MTLIMINSWHEFWIFLVEQSVILLHPSDLLDIPVIHVLVVHGEHVPHGVPERRVHCSQIFIWQPHGHRRIFRLSCHLKFLWFWKYLTCDHCGHKPSWGYIKTLISGIDVITLISISSKQLFETKEFIYRHFQIIIKMQILHTDTSQK